MKETAEVFTLPRGTFAIAPIQYHCDLTRREGRVIQIGAIAEIVFPRLRGLGLIARTELDAGELELIGAVAARTIARPFDMLVKELEVSWKNSRPSEAITYFSARTHGSLVFGAAEPKEIPAHINVAAGSRDGKCAPASAIVSVRGLIVEALSDRMLELIWDSSPPTLASFQQVGEKLAA